MNSLAIAILLSLTALSSFAATVEGTAKLSTTGQPVHNITVVLLPLGRVVETNDAGFFRFEGVPAGKYALIGTGEGLASLRQNFELADGDTASLELLMGLSPLRQEINVTSSSTRVETALETISSTVTLDTTALAGKQATSLGDVLDGEPGIHRRSFGPGTTRPVIRGFDGDRILILQDGMRTGSLGLTSGDHGEPVDPQGLDRVEVVRGPATLLYGSSAMGGVVNMITGHHEAKDQGHRGLHGYLSGIAGTNNGLHGSSAGIDYGWERFVFRMNGGGQRSSDYRTPEERIFNSRTRGFTGNLGGSYYGNRNWLTAGFTTQRFFYQIPNAPEEDHDDHDDHGKDHHKDHHDDDHHHHENVALPVDRWAIRLNGGQRDRFQYSFNYSDYQHRELEGDEIGTSFFNKLLDYRFLVEQPRRGPWSGSFGVWGLRRDYEAIGEEAIVPPTIQNAFAIYGVESVDLDRLRLQFGGRVETNRYRPQFGRERNFTGFSGSAGATYRLDANSVLVGNFSRAYRAPAMEELYANGPHPGLFAFEVGNENLFRERMHGLDFSYRRQDGRIRSEFNVFRYWLSNQVYLAPTGEIEDGLPVADYLQGDSSYTGVDARLDAGLTNWAWLKLGFDSVRTELARERISLPRTPPVRGRVGMDFRYKALSLQPEIVLANRQDRVFTNEVPTAGYGTVNVRGVYTLVRQHTIHSFGLLWFNANNQLYRNHLSFIKEFAPEIGRGVQFNYSLRFF